MVHNEITWKQQRLCEFESHKQRYPPINGELGRQNQKQHTSNEGLLMDLYKAQTITENTLPWYSQFLAMEGLQATKNWFRCSLISF